MTTSKNNWLLPTEIEELHPPQAEAFNSIERSLLQILFNYGYRFILPPAVEYAHSLVLNTKSDPEHKPVVFYDTDPPLGLRADFTPQAARVDAGGASERIRDDIPNRLCYSGEIFRRHGEHEHNPYHLGAELFGEADIDADLEVIDLLMNCITSIYTEDYILSLGHAAFCQKLLERAGLQQRDSERYLRLLAAKSVDKIVSFVSGLGLASPLCQALAELPHLYGDEAVVDQAIRLVRPLAYPQVDEILAQLQALSQAIKKMPYPKMRLFLDLAEVPGSGYSYHNGPVFGVYLADHSLCFAKGGRYDAIGEHYGIGRAATGFSINLGALFRYLARRRIIHFESSPLIFAPYAPQDKSLSKTVRALRNKNQRIVCAFKKNQDASTLGCSAELVREENEWQIKQLSGKE